MDSDDEETPTKDNSTVTPVPDPSSDDMRSKWSLVSAQLWSWFPFKDSFVFAPAIVMIANAGLAVGLCQITSDRDNTVEMAQGARMITLVSNAAISIVTLTFSLTVLSIQIASQTYTPRLLDEFLKDPVSKIVFSVNLGAYAFCFTALYYIDDTGTEKIVKVPYVTIHFLTVHIVLILFTFVNFVHFFINGFRIEKILARASTSSLQAARALSASLNTELDDEIEVPNHSRKVMSSKSGYVKCFHLHELLPLAEKMDICIRYNLQAGEFVNEGTVMCYVWDLNTRNSENKIGDRMLELLPCLQNEDDFSIDKKLKLRLEKYCSRGVEICSGRSSDYDVTLGIQQLNDVAVRALSPGVNDPHTAIQCMDVLEPLLAKLGVMRLGVPNYRDSDDNVRVCAPRRSFSHLCSMMDGIRTYGGSDLNVCRRGLRLFGDLAFILRGCTSKARLNTCLDQMEQWRKTSRQSFDEGSPELRSVESLYEHLLCTVADSHSVLLQNEEGDTVKDIQAFETTFKSQDEEDERTNAELAMDFLRKWTGTEPDSDNIRSTNEKRLFETS